jgi:ferredoxin
MDCFYEDGMMLYIDPKNCIDCDACVPECPVEAIHHDSRLPAAWAHYAALNAERSAALIAAGAGPLVERQEPKLGPGCKRAGTTS